MANLSNQSGLGCHINGTYMGALGYADDITLTCPSLYGLNYILDICNQFAKNKHVIFNTVVYLSFLHILYTLCVLVETSYRCWGEASHLHVSFSITPEN